MIRLAKFSDECTNTDARFYLHIVPSDTDVLPESSKAYGFDVLDFSFAEAVRIESPKCVLTRGLPEYDIADIFTGRDAAGGRLWVGGTVKALTSQRRNPTRCEQIRLTKRCRNSCAKPRAENSLIVEDGSWDWS